MLMKFQAIQRLGVMVSMHACAHSISFIIEPGIKYQSSEINPDYNICLLRLFVSRHPPRHLFTQGVEKVEAPMTTLVPRGTRATPQLPKLRARRVSARPHGRNRHLTPMTYSQHSK